MTDIPLTKAKIEQLASFDHHLLCNDDCIQKRLGRQLLVTMRERDILDSLLNTPEIHDLIKAVPLESAHQRQRWGSNHDDGKTPADWFWLIGYLAGKALHSQTSGNTDKALHHLITTAAALANWHAAILGKTDMRPGIVAPDKATEGAVA